MQGEDGVGAGGVAVLAAKSLAAGPRQAARSQS